MWLVSVVSISCPMTIQGTPVCVCVCVCVCVFKWDMINIYYLASKLLYSLMHQGHLSMSLSISFPLSFFFSIPCSLQDQDLSSLTRDWTWDAAVKVLSHATGLQGTPTSILFMYLFLLECNCLTVFCYLCSPAKRISHTHTVPLPYWAPAAQLRLTPRSSQNWVEFLMLHSNVPPFFLVVTFHSIVWMVLSSVINL